MKSERRHELQQNSLVRAIENFPTFWKEHGSKIALAVIATCLVVVLVRLWVTGRTEKADRVAQDLSWAETQLDELHDPALAAGDDFAEKRRATIEKVVQDAVANALNSDDGAQQALAKVIRGDLYWRLAMLADLPAGATTRPTSQPAAKQNPAELLDKAAADYRSVISQAASAPAQTVARAHFGLAAVNENRGRFHEAHSSYEAIIQDARVGKTVQNLAKSRMDELKAFETPPLIGHFRKPATELGPDFTGLFPTTRTTAPATGAATTSQASTTLPAGTQPGTARPETGPASAPTGFVGTGPVTVPSTQPATTTTAP